MTTKLRAIAEAATPGCASCKDARIVPDPQPYPEEKPCPECCPSGWHQAYWLRERDKNASLLSRLAAAEKQSEVWQFKHDTVLAALEAERAAGEARVVAYTPSEYPGRYPPYLNIKLKGDQAIVSVRGPELPDGKVGLYASITVPAPILAALSKQEPGS